MMQTHTITGGGGTRLHVVETGNPAGQPILFVHGFSQSYLSWHKQLHSSLAETYRLVALDNRGHGFSEKPHDAYTDTRLWADDIHAVLTTLGLQQPVLVGWSYGGFIISSYLSVYGDAALGGIVFVGAISKLTDNTIPQMIGPDFLGLLPGFFAEDVAASVAALTQFMRLVVYAEPSAEDFYWMLGFNTVVPPSVRQGLLSHRANHDDDLARLTKPLLLIYGDQDAIVLPAVAQAHAQLVSHARLSWYPDVGHSPFWEMPDRFNQELYDFVGAL
jgi:pimeloyl-ACP methyl ester carboxylesterase